MRLLDLIETPVREKYSRDNLSLLRYMKSGRDDVDIYHFWSQFARRWAEEVDGYIDWYEQAHPKGMGWEYDIDGYEPPSDLPPELVKSFQKYIVDEAIPALMHNDPTEVPTWAYMDLNQNKLLERETWLIHFSNNANTVAREGFTIGVDQMDRLGLTTYFNNDGADKSYGGYNFAFKATDPRGYLGGEKYGRHMLMFQNSGVEAWHHGDEENQVMFKGEDVDPRGIILIENDGGDWVVKPHPLSKYVSPRDEDGLVRFEDMEKVVAWVQQNLAQYRKVITGY